MSFVAIPGSYTGLVHDELIQEEGLCCKKWKEDKMKREGL
jgi:hypothetical protein